MSGAISKIPEEFKTLSSNERIEYVQGLWEFIAQTPDHVPIPESHKQVLDQRLAANVVEPDSAQSWSQARDSILKTLRKT